MNTDKVESRSERALLRVINAVDTRDGDGVKIKRIAGTSFNALLDPFLMIDEIKADEASDYIGGFPPHPHRGFETITYMIEGGFRHRDHLGNEGAINAGGAQWMTAGRGIIHSEMPEQEEGRMHGLQLWVNLPAAEKMCEPSWRDVQAAEMAHVRFDNGVTGRVLAGRVVVLDQTGAIAGPIQTLTDITLADLQLPPEQQLPLLVAEEYTALVLVLEGALGQLQAGQLGVFGHGELLRVTATDQGARILLLSGVPLREPIVQYGPFVMNTREQIEAALDDYRHNRFGGA